MSYEEIIKLENKLAKEKMKNARLTGFLRGINFGVASVIDNTKEQLKYFDYDNIEIDDTTKRDLKDYTERNLDYTKRIYKLIKEEIEKNDNAKHKP